MGFVKRGEFEALKQEVASLKKGGVKSSTRKKTAKKAAAPKPAAKKSVTKKAVKTKKLLKRVPRNPLRRKLPSNGSD